MENSIYIGLSRQAVLQSNMAIVSNNIANMNTSGYRAQNMLFEEYISDPRYGDDELSLVYDYGQYQNTDQGSMTQTGNDLNVALEGPGFMAVQMLGGETGYTRDGDFQRTADGTLVNASGLPILGNGGPLIIPADATEVSIDENGVVSTQNGQVGQLQVVEFENVQDLEPVGGNLYRTDGASRPATETRVSQGFLEGANVNPIVETTRMIEILREFQSLRRVLDGEHERLRDAIDKLTRV